MSTTPPQKVTADPGRMMVSKLVSVWCSAYFQGRTASFWEVKHINKQNRQKVCDIVCCFETTSCWTMSSMTPLLTQQPAANSWFLTQNPSWDKITLSSRIVWSPICKTCISFVHCSKCFHYCWRNHGKRWQKPVQKTLSSQHHHNSWVFSDVVQLEDKHKWIEGKFNPRWKSTPCCNCDVLGKCPPPIQMIRWCWKHFHKTAKDFSKLPI